MTAFFTGYRIVTTVVSPLLLPAFLVSPRGRRGLWERYGYWDEISHNPFWFHGSSVGEVRGLEPVIKNLYRELVLEKSLLTATSPTALATEKPDLIQRLAPIDCPFAVSRALKAVEPRAYIFGETELWPNLLNALLVKNVPIHLVNGRISDYTFRRYLTFRNLFAPFLRRFRSLSVVSNEAGERFCALGASPESIAVTGNAKYDSDPSVRDDSVRTAIRQELFPGISDETPVLVLGSLRPHEEKWWFQAIKESLASGNKLAVAIAPRHSEKYDYFAKELERVALSFRRLSEKGRVGSADVLLIDSMGVLEKAYSIAAMAFIGATLVDIGGHNPLEAVQYGVPVVVGPHVSVIRDIIRDLRDAGGVLEVKNAQDISVLLERMIRFDRSLKETGKRGYDVWLKHRGAARRIVEHILSTGNYD